MSHQVGSANTLSQLLSRLADFAQTNGWTIDKLDTITPALYLHNADGFWSMTGPVLTIFGNTGFNSGASAGAQPGSSATNHGTGSAKNSYAGTRCDTLEGGNYVSYDFFGTADYLHVAIQVKSNQFRHFGIGTIVKEGTFNGGQYAYGTAFLSLESFTSNNAFPFQALSTANNWNDSASLPYSTVVRADLDSGPFWYVFGRMDRNELEPGTSATGIGDGGYFDSCHPDRLSAQVAFTQFGQVVAPVPVTVYVRTADGIYRRLGYVPDFFVCQMPGVVPRSDYTVGGEQWRLIPAMQLQTTTDDVDAGQNNSYTLGYAFRIVS
jgi:hypothetical protein